MPLFRRKKKESTKEERAEVNRYLEEYGQSIIDDVARTNEESLQYLEREMARHAQNLSPAMRQFAEDFAQKSLERQRAFNLRIEEGVERNIRRMIEEGKLDES